MKRIVFILMAGCIWWMSPITASDALPKELQCGCKNVLLMQPTSKKMSDYGTVSTTMSERWAKVYSREFDVRSTAKDESLWNLTLLFPSSGTFKPNSFPEFLKDFFYVRVIDAVHVHVTHERSTASLLSSEAFWGIRFMQDSQKMLTTIAEENMNIITPERGRYGATTYKLKNFRYQPNNARFAYTAAAVVLVGSVARYLSRSAKNKEDTKRTV